MAVQIQFRRGNTAQHSVFTGAVGEVTVDTDKDILVVHDGSTVGGFPLAPIFTYDLTNTAFNQANTGTTIATASFGKANDAYTIAIAAFDTANNSGVGIAAYGQANIATEIAIASFDKVNAVAIGANSYADTVGAGANAWVSANFTTLAAGVAAYDYANTVGTIAVNAYDEANSANLLAYNTGIGANAFTSETIAGANNAVGTGANTYAAAVGVAANNFASATIAGANSAVGSGANAYADIVGTSANSYLLTVIAGANTEVGAGANSYADVVGSSANLYLLSVIAGANAAVGAGANTVGSAAFDKANTAETIAIAAYANSNTKLSTSGGTITGDLAVVGNLAISGNTSYISVQNYRVDDPLVYLAGNNYISDIVDIGFIGNYVNSTGSNVHTGLFRNHEDKEYYLFYGYDQEPENNHIDPNGNNFTLAVLNTDIRTSNLVLGGQNAITWITSAYDKANAANVLAYDTGIGANAYADTVGTSANAFFSSVISGSNVIVTASFNQANLAIDIADAAYDKANAANVLAFNTGVGANAYANLVWSRSNSFTSATIAGANTAVGAGANAFTSATIAGANTAVGAGANTVGSAAFAKANGAAQLAFVTVAANGTNLVADSNNGTLTLATSGNVSIIGNATNDTATFDLTNTGVTASTYGNTSVIPVIVVDAKGRITSVTNTAISSSGGGLSLSDQTTSTSTHYVTLTTSSTGSISGANVSTTKLYFVPSTGTLSATVFNSLSDINYKKDINTLENALNKVNNLRGVSFVWKDNENLSSGVIAQEIEKVAPELVTETNGIKNVNYDGLIGYLIESIKELKARIEELENDK